MPTKRELVEADDRAWDEFLRAIEPLAPARLEEPGYHPATDGDDAWSVKDLVAHIGNWMAYAGHVFERIRMGTYTDERLDVDAMNREFYETNRDLPLSTVRAECWAARTRMLQAFDPLAEVTPEAEEWFVEDGPNHIAEHLPRLVEWSEELRAR